MSQNDDVLDSIRALLDAQYKNKMIKVQMSLDNTTRKITENIFQTIILDDLEPLTKIERIAETVRKDTKKKGWESKIPVSNEKPISLAPTLNQKERQRVKARRAKDKQNRKRK